MSITTPEGFSAAALASGIKSSGKPDLTLVVNNGPQYSAAASFTRNQIKASPVKYTQEIVSSGTIKAVLLNSGNANACNGAQGDADTKESAELAAAALGVSASEVAVCSTGLIGDVLPMEKIRVGIETMSTQLSTEAGTHAAEAIMTTDTVAKESIFHGDGFSVGGMGKGVGMMAPSLATMLVVITTDANVTSEMLQIALDKAVQPTFNTLDIDGSTSTNDTVLLLASGRGATPSQSELDEAVLSVCSSLADQMQADAEGVTKRVRIVVEGAATDEDALTAARVLGRDNLFKTAMFGSDPNWGRVLAAVGMAPVEMDPDNISVYFNDHAVCLGSTGTPNAREVDLSGTDIEVRVDLGTAKGGSAFVRTTDLSHDYVEINSAYST